MYGQQLGVCKWEQAVCLLEGLKCMDVVPSNSFAGLDLHQGKGVTLLLRRALYAFCDCDRILYMICTIRSAGPLLCRKCGCWCCISIHTAPQREWNHVKHIEAHYDLVDAMTGKDMSSDLLIRCRLGISLSTAWQMSWPLATRQTLWPISCNIRPFNSSYVVSTWSQDMIYSIMLSSN